ncbi:MAG: SDR family NAD(P)-dependent oxidoreductase [Planctomycetota bacterium]
MSQPLSNRVALVTGASAGIGWATATSLAAAGCRVAVSARRVEKLEALVGEIAAAGGEAKAFPADVSDPAATDAMWAEVCDWAGGVPEIVVANAGRGLAGGVLSSDESAWESLFKLNVTGTMHFMRIVAGAMKAKLEAAGVTPADTDFPGADLVVLGSTVGSNVSPFSGAYGASKFAVEGAVEALRREVGSTGIRVTNIKPGIVLSEFQDVAGYDEENFGKTVAKFGKMLQPEDIARTICHIVSEPPHVHVNTVTIRPVGQDYP